MRLIANHKKGIDPLSFPSILWMGFSFLIAWHAITPILPLYSMNLGASVLLTGIILSIFPGVLLVSLIPFGIIAERIGGGKLLLFAFLLQITSLVCLASASTAGVLLLGWGLYGIASSSFFPVSTGISLNRATRGNRGVIIGRFYTALGAGMVIGPVLVSFLTKYMYYREVIVCLIAFPISGLIVLLYNLGKGAKVSLIEEKSNTTAEKSNVSLLKDATITVIFLVNVLYFIAIGAFDTFFPIYAASSLGFSASLISLLFAVRGGFNVLCREPSGFLSDRLGRKNLFVSALFLSTISFIVLTFSQEGYTITTIMALFGGAWAMRLTSSSATLGDRLPSRSISLAMAVFYASGFAGSMTGSLMAGVLGDKYIWLFFMTPLILVLMASVILTMIFFTRE